MLVEVLLTDEAVRTTGHARVGGVDDNSISRERRRIHGIEDTANLDIEETDVAIILRKHLLHIGLLARPLQELFVPDNHLAVVERVLRQEVRRQRDRGDVVFHREAIGDDVRVVRTIEGEVGEERFLAVL